MSRRRQTGPELGVRCGIFSLLGDRRPMGSAGVLIGGAGTIPVSVAPTTPTASLALAAIVIYVSASLEVMRGRSGLGGLHPLAP